MKIVFYLVLAQVPTPYRPIIMNESQHHIFIKGPIIMNPQLDIKKRDRLSIPFVSFIRLYSRFD